MQVFSLNLRIAYISWRIVEWQYFDQLGYFPDQQSKLISQSLTRKIRMSSLLIFIFYIQGFSFIYANSSINHRPVRIHILSHHAPAAFLWMEKKSVFVTLLIHFVYFLYIVIWFNPSDRTGTSRTHTHTLFLALPDISAIHHQTKLLSTKHKS